MSIIGIVAISILAALFLFALLAGVGFLTWVAFRLKRMLTEAQTGNAAIHAETKAQIDAARNSFATIRSEVTRSLENHQTALQAVLAVHRQEMAAGIEKINAEALTTVAVRLTQVCVRVEKAVSVLQQLILDTEKAPGAEYGAEQFAEEESVFGAPPSGFSVSPTAQLDAEADAAAARHVTTESFVEA